MAVVNKIKWKKGKPILSSLQYLGCREENYVGKNGKGTEIFGITMIIKIKKPFTFFPKV